MRAPRIAFRLKRDIFGGISRAAFTGAVSDGTQVNQVLYSRLLYEKHSSCRIQQEEPVGLLPLSFDFSIFSTQCSFSASHTATDLC